MRADREWAEVGIREGSRLAVGAVGMVKVLTHAWMGRLAHQPREDCRIRPVVVGFERQGDTVALGLIADPAQVLDDGREDALDGVPLGDTSP